jgi:TolB-like protein/Tfp pilus assembly protein PilF
MPASSAAKGYLVELRRRKVFRTTGLYVVGAWLVMQIADVLFPGWGLPDRAINILFIAALLGFPLALVFGWFYDITTHGIVRTPPADRAATETPLSLQRRDYLILAALAAVGIAILSDATRQILETPRVSERDMAESGLSVAEEKLPNSIAVLPFRNLSEDPDNDFFSDGVSEEILNRLGSFPRLNVIGRTSSFAFKGSDYPLRRISDLLGALYLLEGSVRRQGERLRIAAQLLDASGVQLWSESFDRTLGDIFSIQTEIAEVVASTVVPQIVGPSNAPYEPPLEAYQHFLAGRELLRRREDLEEAREQLQYAIDLDPRYALAYAELAITYLIGTVTAEEIASANQAIDTALRLEPGMPRALAARALSLQQQNEPDWAVSEIVLREVLEREPNMVDALNWLSIALRVQGKRLEAGATMERAARLDPLHGAIAVNVARLSARRGDFEKAERRLLRLLEMPQAGSSPTWILLNLYRRTGQLVDMNALAKRDALDESPYFGLVDNYALLGLWDQSSYWAERTKTDLPDSFWVRTMSAWVPQAQGRFRDSLDEWDKMLAGVGKTLAEMPNSVILIYGDVQALGGDFDGAIRTLEPLIGPPRPINYREFDWFETDALHSLAWSYQQTGKAEKGAPMLASLEQQLDERDRSGLLHESNDLYFFARNALMMGDHELALERLRRAVAAGWRDYYVEVSDPIWAELRDNPDYQALMAEVKADVDRQRAEVEEIDSGEDFPALLDQARAARRASGD